MFTSARLKLTAWYLLIIMVISLSFSTVIYRMFSLEVERFARVQRFRIERGLLTPLPVPDESELPLPRVLDATLLDDVRHHFLLYLALINAGVFIVSGGLGYLLAGRTLQPIKEMVDEQHRFISDASHELRTPLTALKSSLEVNIRDPKLTLADAKVLLKESITDVNKLQTLSDALLQLAQYEKPVRSGSFTNVRLSEVVTDAIKRVQAMAKQKEITVTSHVQQISIVADAQTLTDLLVILCDNAIKYSPPDSTVTVTAKRTDGMASISVADHGLGIRDKDLPHIFDRFYRADAARSKEHAGGYGLGLAIAKKIAEQHDGTIQVQSAIHKGSTFTVRLPLTHKGNV